MTFDPAIGGAPLGDAYGAPAPSTVPPRERDRAWIMYLADITLVGGMQFFVSDRIITWDGTEYQDYLDGFEELTETLARADSSGLNDGGALRFRNDPYMAHLHLIELHAAYPFATASVTIREAYLDDDGSVLDAQVVFVGSLDEPRLINGLTFTCEVSAREFAADSRW